MDHRADRLRKRRGWSRPPAELGWRHAPGGGVDILSGDGRELRPVGGQIPCWGPHAEAPGLLALWQRHSAGEIDYVAQEHGLVVALTPIERRQTRLAGERGPVHLAPAGSINIIPAGADHWGCWGDEKESAYLALSAQRLNAVAVQHFDADAVELAATNRQQSDPVLLHLATLLRDELRGGGLMTELYMTRWAR